MPIHVTVEKASRVVVFRVTGNPDIQEMIESVDRALADSCYQSGYNFLSDRRELNCPPSPDLVNAAVGFLESNQDRLSVRRWAFVVSDVENYRIARKASILSAPISTEVEVFTNLADARHWLAQGFASSTAQQDATTS